MKLDELIDKYPDDRKAFRASRHMSPKPLSWCRDMKAWGCQEARDLGFIIPQFMIEDANADDWELVKEL